MADLSQIDEARNDAVLAYRRAIEAGADVVDAVHLVADGAFEFGREVGAGDMERIERQARGDELEAWAAATLRRANEVRGDVGLELAPVFGRGSASRREAELALALRDVAAHGGKADVFIPASKRDSTPEHRYWSTHCRHDRHGDCSADAMRGQRADGSPVGSLVWIERKPAQCKTCAAPCICPCHTETADES